MNLLNRNIINYKLKHTHRMDLKSGFVWSWPPAKTLGCWCDIILHAFGKQRERVFRKSKGSMLFWSGMDLNKGKIIENFNVHRLITDIYKAWLFCIHKLFRLCLHILCNAPVCLCHSIRALCISFSPFLFLIATLFLYFHTTHKMTSRPSILAGAPDHKNPDSYFKGITKLIEFHSIKH